MLNNCWTQYSPVNCHWSNVSHKYSINLITACSCLFPVYTITCKFTLPPQSEIEHNRYLNHNEYRNSFPLSIGYRLYDYRMDEWEHSYTRTFRAIKRLDDSVGTAVTFNRPFIISDLKHAVSSLIWRELALFRYHWTYQT